MCRRCGNPVWALDAVISKGWGVVGSVLFGVRWGSEWTSCLSMIDADSFPNATPP